MLPVRKDLFMSLAKKSRVSPRRPRGIFRRPPRRMRLRLTPTTWPPTGGLSRPSCVLPDAARSTRSLPQSWRSFWASTAWARVSNPYVYRRKPDGIGERRESDYWFELETMSQSFGGRRWWFMCQRHLTAGPVRQEGPLRASVHWSRIWNFCSIMQRQCEPRSCPGFDQDGTPRGKAG
jgi:hypothetical protein